VAKEIIFCHKKEIFRLVLTAQSDKKFEHASSDTKCLTGHSVAKHFGIFRMIRLGHFDFYKDF
jgi:hypothetical protein